MIPGEASNPVIVSLRGRGDKEGSIVEEQEDTKEDDGLLYRVGEVPPWYQCFLYGFQHYLLAAAGLMSLPLVTMNVLCADGSEEANTARTSILGTVFVTSGIATFVQSTFGLRLPILQGITASYFIPTMVIMSSKEWECPAALDLSRNSTATYSLVHSNESKTYLVNALMNQTVEIEPGFNYYQEYDGLIANSNEVWQKRIREIQGAVIMCSLLQIAVGASGIIGFALRFIGPLTVAPILVLLTYSLIDVTMHEASKQWVIALFVAFAFYCCSLVINKVEVPIPKFNFRKRSCILTRQPIFGQFPVIVSILLAWFLCLIITLAGGFPDDPSKPAYYARTDAKPRVIANSPWFRVPYPCQWGLPTLSVASAFGMLAGVFPGIFESIGVYQSCAKITHEPSPPSHAVNRAVLMEGIGIFLAGILGNGNSTTSFSDNVVGIEITKVASRRVFQYASGILVFLGVFTKFCSVFVTIPDAVIGGVMLTVIGMIGSIGVSALSRVDMSKSRNIFIFGFSTFFALAVAVYARSHSQELDVGVPEVNHVLSILLQIPMFIGGLTGCVLDNITPGSIESRGLADPNDDSSATAPVYQLPFKTDWEWTRWIPICPRFGAKRTRFADA